MAYVDGFLLPIATDQLEAYRVIADRMAAIWMEHGALSVVEARADDASYGKITSFPRAVLQTEGETVIFSYITYRDRAHREDVKAKVIADPRMNEMDMSFVDGKRMVWGGFEVIVAR